MRRSCRPHTVIPAPHTVIPVKAGIHTPAYGYAETMLERCGVAQAIKKPPFRKRGVGGILYLHLHLHLCLYFIPKRRQLDALR